MKSVVLEIDGRHAVAVTDAGDFVKIRNKNYRVGQRIITHDLKFKRIKLATAATAAAIALFAAGGAYAYYTPYTEVSLDVNPSIVLQLNYFDKVIDAAAMNDDAEQVLAKLDIINQDVNTAMDEVVDALSEQGYIDPLTDADIVVTATSQDQTRAREMLEAAERKIEQKTEQLRIHASVTGECVGQQLVTRAREYDVSPGKLMLVEKYALSTGDPASVDVSAWLDKPVKEIMTATKENKKAAKRTDSSGSGDADDANDDADDEQAAPSAAPSEADGSPKGTVKNGNGPKTSATPKPNNSNSGKDTGESKNGKQNGSNNGKRAATPGSACTPICSEECTPAGDANKYKRLNGNN